MLLKGHLLLAPGIPAVVFAEPIGEILCDLRHPLALLPAGNGRARAARAARIGAVDALILRGAPERRLPPAGVADDRDMFPIHLRLLLQPVADAAGRKCPGAQGPPGVIRPGGGIRFKDALDPVLKPVVAVGVHIPGVKGRRRIAARDHRFDRPEAARLAPVRVRMILLPVVDKDDSRTLLLPFGEKGGKREGEYAIWPADLRLRQPAQRPPLHGLAGIGHGELYPEILRRDAIFLACEQPQQLPAAVLLPALARGLPLHQQRDKSLLHP